MTRADEQLKMLIGDDESEMVLACEDLRTQYSISSHIKKRWCCRIVQSTRSNSTEDHNLTGEKTFET